MARVMRCVALLGNVAGSLDRWRHGDGRGWPTALLVGAAALTLYLGTLAETPSGDSLEFAEAVLRPSALDFLEAHQVLVHPLAWV